MEMSTQNLLGGLYQNVGVELGFNVNGGNILGDLAGKSNSAKARNIQFISLSLFLRYIGHILSHEAICHIRLLAIWEWALKSNLINQVLEFKILVKIIESFSAT